ncbi:MAG: GntR family transcriptional regulator [Anaerolineae bacterium]|nr:GntR family transcriptional regulator [Anaerolineae bacterium]
MRVIRSKPISEQVNTIIRERFRDATYAPGFRLPSESELSKEFGVSRATIRTVLAKLAVEGLILRKQGDGTYVNERIQEVNTHLGGLWDFAHLIERSGFEVSIQPLLIKKVAATEDEAHVLAIDAGIELLSMTRLFSANSQPVILAKNLIPASLLLDQNAEIDGHLRIREILKQYFRQEISFVTTEISSALAGEDAHILNIRPKTHLLNLKMTFYSKDNQPLTLGKSFLNDDILKLRLVQAWN